MRRIFRFFRTRAFLCGFLIVLQLIMLAGLLRIAGVRPLLFYPPFFLVSALAALWAAASGDHPAYQLSWSLLILLFPILGAIFYFFSRLSLHGSRAAHAHTRLTRPMSVLNDKGTKASHRLHAFSGYPASLQSSYIQNSAHFPLYENTSVRYLSPGEQKLEAMLWALRRAERFIFLEYFIISEGDMWQQILSVLKEKAAAGLDVRVLYDDAGCMDLLPRKYPDILRSWGIACRVFNRFTPRPLLHLNHRDHRKLLIIDGVTGFTGGVNIGDEYINAQSPHGHWKDAAVILYGEAVFSMTVMFLQLWDYHEENPPCPLLYSPRPYSEMPFISDGFIQPFGDMPIGGESVGHQVYLNMISRARRQLLISTPYLILDERLSGALCLAAKSGVDVRIITPGKGDKWFVHTTTKAHYLPLLRAGVRLFEYSPGFIHSKMMIADGNLAVIGSINFDYRSLFLHFECGVWMCGCRAIKAMQEDFFSTQAQCAPITQEQMRRLPWYFRLSMGILRLFAPLM